MFLCFYILEFIYYDENLKNAARLRGESAFVILNLLSLCPS